MPAPITIVSPPGITKLAFHTRATEYVVPAVMGTTFWAKAAVGEKVPAEPPDSFQTTASALGQLPAGRLAAAATQMPRSWLYFHAIA